MNRMPLVPALSALVALLSLTGCGGADDGEDPQPRPVAEYCEFSAEAGTHDSWEPFHSWFEGYRAGTEEMPADARVGWKIRVDAFATIDEEFFEEELQWDEWYDGQDWWSPEEQADLAVLKEWENSVCPPRP